MTNAAYLIPGCPPTIKQVLPQEEFRKLNPKCKGCPYGNRQHCVGVCWKDIYEPYLKKKKTVTITETTTETTEITIE